MFSARETAVRFTGLIAVALALSGCVTAPDSVSTEIEHVSHPLAGWPVSASNTEDALSQANVIARWQIGRVYVEHGIGYNLQGRDGSGFYGPGLTYTGRVGVTLWSRQ
jgi:hypothetical protein